MVVLVRVPVLILFLTSSITLTPGTSCACCWCCSPHTAKNHTFTGSRNQKNFGVKRTSASASDDPPHSQPYFYPSPTRPALKSPAFPPNTAAKVPWRCCSPASAAHWAASIRAPCGTAASGCRSPARTCLASALAALPRAGTHCVHDCGSSKPFPLYVSLNHCGGVKGLPGTRHNKCNRYRLHFLPVPPN